MPAPKSGFSKGGTRGSTQLRHRLRRCGGRPQALLRAGRLSHARHHRDQPVPAGRRGRRRHAPARGGARADRAEACRDRHQGGRGRAGRRAGRRQCQARRLHAAVPFHLDLRLCRGRPAVRPPAEIHQCRFHSARALRRRSLRPHLSTISSRTRRCRIRRRRQEAAQRDHLQLVGTLRRAAHSDGAVHERRPAI